MVTDRPPVEAAHHPQARADGRRARRDRNRVEVLDAVIELFSEDHLVPGVQRVAERSGVSPRSIYRYFADQDALLRAAIGRHLQRVADLGTVPELGRGPLDGRIERMVAVRLRLYREVAPTARAARAAADGNRLIREEVERGRRLLRAQIEQHFAPELDARPPTERHAMVASIDVLCQYEALDHFFMHRGFAEAEAHAVLTWSVRAVLAAGGERPT